MNRRTLNLALRLTSIIAIAVMVCFICWNNSAHGQSASDELESGFVNPPDSARPRVWWHWMNGNITKEGIRLDLEWMKRVGIGGFQNFDASLGTPQVVDKRLVFMTPEWKDAFNYAATLADQKGLEMAIAGSPGWSESGGPWVKPAEAMKKVVWTETLVEGGRPFSGNLPKPASTTGQFQNLPQREFSYRQDPSPQYYADSEVVAYRLPEQDLPQAILQPKVTSSGGNIDVPLLSDGDLARTTDLPKAPVGQQAWIQFEYPKPVTIRAITIGVRRPYQPNEVWSPIPESGLALEASDDGQTFRPVVAIPYSRIDQRTMDFPAVTARYFRVTFTTPAAPSQPQRDYDGTIIPQPDAHRISELILHTGPRINFFEEKAAFAPTPKTLLDSAISGDGDAIAIQKSDVVDLTSRMSADGSLNWTPPAGRWVVLRLGYSLTGHRNGPASPEATGLEVDKLNKKYVTDYFNNYLDQYKSATGSLMGKRGLKYVITDSWEAGLSNWTDDLIGEFTRRRGYSPIPYLPVLTGKVVGSMQSSEQFLWDFRKTLADLVAEYHYDNLTELLHSRGMGRYSESHESGRALIADGMEVKRKADVPMSAMWTARPGERSESFGYKADIRESASVAHIYGQNLVAAESLTAAGTAWQWSPETLKPTADLELACGLNRFVIHTSVHQPLSDKFPGLSLGPFGQWFTRHETWAEEAGPWITYLSRSSYMLQQGKFVADVAYFYGEDTNITALFGDKAPPVPAGYNFDYVNADALVHAMSVDGGKITTPGGTSYRLLALDPNSRYMSLPVLHKIRDLVEAGASVVGGKPIGTPSLSDDQTEFHKVADAVWGSGTSAHPFGKGTVYPTESIAEALAAMKISPDFQYTKPQSDTNLLYVHRSLPDGDMYWVDNRNNRTEGLEATFRVSGRAAELWHPETGKIEPAAYKFDGVQTVVPLHLNPGEAVFVMFRGNGAAPSRTLPGFKETSLATIEGPWDLRFQPDRGAPAQISLDKLASWSENADPGVKYFSGSATYVKTLNAQPEWFRPVTHMWLDLGDVKNLAEVVVNGKSLGLVWKHPFRVDATEALKPGPNAIEIKVTNLWVNRLIGDQQADAPKKYTFTTFQYYRANSPLVPSGLLGPVQVVRVSRE